MNRKIIPFFTLLCLTILSSCDNEVDVPAYIQVDSVNFETSSGQGSNSEDIQFVWIFVDGNLRGAFPLETKIPILETGNHTIRVYAGIYDNGSRSRPEINFIMEPSEHELNLQAGETFSLNANFQYIDFADFLFVEGFETGNIFRVDLDDFPGSTLETTNKEEEVFEGNASGFLEVDSVLITNAVSHNDVYTNFGVVGAEMYLELDYHTETSLLIGILGVDRFGTDQYLPIISLFPNEEYEKIYIDLGTVVGDNLIEAFQVFLQVNYTPNTEKNIQRVYLDNLKIVYADQ